MMKMLDEMWEGWLIGNDGIIDVVEGDDRWILDDRDRYIDWILITHIESIKYLEKGWVLILSHGLKQLDLSQKNLNNELKFIIIYFIYDSFVPVSDRWSFFGLASV